MTADQEPFPPSEALADLIDEVQALARAHTKCDWGAAVLYVPLVLLTGGLLQLSTEDESALKTTPVPDQWVVRAAELHSASLRNLKRLQAVLREKGFVSIEDADRFCCVELERERQALVERQRQSALTTSLGASVLAARIEAAGIEPTFQEAMTQGRKYLADVMAAGAGLAAFSAEKAVWMGKGLGALAGAMRELRKR